MSLFHITTHRSESNCWFRNRNVLSCERFQAPKLVSLPQQSASEEIMLISKRPGDTEGGSEKFLPSLEVRLMTLKGSFQSYTSLDDMDDNY